MNKLKYMLTFIFGAGVGAAVSWKLLEQKFEILAQEKIDSVKELYSKKNKEESSDEVKEEPEVQEEIKDESDEYSTILNETGYNTSPVVKEKNMKRPYVIAPEESGETGYEIDTLYYFADGVLTDDTETVIENVDDLVGEDSLEAFGRYEDDSVFVRNDELEKDFEILLDHRSYHDVVSGGSKAESEDQ